MSTDDFAVLDNLEMIVVVDNETDTLSSIDPGVDQMAEMASLLTRLLPTRYHDGHPGVSVFDHLCVACHGFSVLLRGRRGEEVRSVLFDVGPYGGTWLDNAARWIDLASIECIFLSHWHADHSGGFPVVVEAIAAARGRGSGGTIRRPTSGPTGPAGRAVAVRDDCPIAAGADVRPDHGGRRKDCPEQRAPPCCGALRRQRPDQRVTEYETGLVGHHTSRDDRGEPDPSILDERLLAAHVRGRGVSVLSACSHAGVVNASLTARELASGLPIDVVLGGYHLAGLAMEQGSMKPSATSPTWSLLRRCPWSLHGLARQSRARRSLAPGRYGPSVVGSRYVLNAQS